MIVRTKQNIYINSMDSDCFPGYHFLLRFPQHMDSSFMFSLLFISEIDHMDLNWLSDRPNPDKDLSFDLDLNYMMNVCLSGIVALDIGLDMMVSTVLDMANVGKEIELEQNQSSVLNRTLVFMYGSFDLFEVFGHKNSDHK